jgi:hypothetical protein
MTTLGKILAIVNLVLSVVVGAFIVMSYVARTNWHSAYERKAQEAKMAKDDALAYKDEVERAQKVITGLQAETRAKDQQVKDTQVAAARSIEVERNRSENAIKQLNEQSAKGNGLTGQTEKLQAEAKYYHDMVDQRNKELANKEKDVQTFRDRAVEMEILSKRTQDMNERLLVQIEDMTKALKVAESGGARTRANGAVAVNPPNEAVEGTIKQTDPASGLVTISIGTDKGVREGNTLDVFRLKPEAAYLGAIVILNARPNEAVGRLTGKGRLPLMVGDKVASNVMNNRYGDQGTQGIH